VGETLSVQGEVTDIEEKIGKKPFDLAHVQLTGIDEAGEIALRGQVAFILFK
jgi:hypothetical protein